MAVLKSICLIIRRFSLLLLISILACSPQVPLSAEEGPTLTQNSVQLMLRDIVIVGSTVFSTEELAALTRPYLGRTYSLIELQGVIQSLVQAINQLYQDNGYLSSGSYFPRQDLTGGIIQIQVIEGGELEAIEITGLQRLQSSYIRERLASAGRAPLNLNRLQVALYRLQADPLIASIRGNLKPGRSPWLRKLAVEVQEAPALRLGGSFDNYESLAVGEQEMRLELKQLNLTGWGARFSAEYTLAEGLEKIYVDYTLPLNSEGSTLKMRYESGNSRIVTPPLDRFDLEGTTQKVGITWQLPFIQEIENNFTLGLTLDWQQNASSLLDRPFSVIPELEDSVSRITALRFDQQWVNRSPRRVLALRSEFSLGLDWLGATVLDNESGLDGRFFSWRGQFQWLESIPPNLTFTAQISGQISGDALLPGERFQVGGFYTVRGFDRNLRTGDSGLTVRVEPRYTPINDPDWGLLTAFVFFDFGLVSNNVLPVPPPDTLASLGVGWEWQWQPVRLRLDLALPLTDSLREQNILFQFQLFDTF